jgi:hypothetical protein
MPYGFMLLTIDFIVARKEEKKNIVCLMILMIFIFALFQNQTHMQQNNQPNNQQLQIQTQNAKLPRGKADAKPRGRMTAYAFFVQTCREEHKKKHPEESVIFAEFSRKCAERWKVSDFIQNSK